MSDEPTEPRRRLIANVLQDALGRTVTIYVSNGERTYHGELKAVESDYLVVDQNGIENYVVLSAIVSFVVLREQQVSEIFMP